MRKRYLVCASSRGRTDPGYFPQAEGALDAERQGRDGCIGSQVFATESVFLSTRAKDHAAHMSADPNAIPRYDTGQRDCHLVHAETHLDAPPS